MTVGLRGSVVLLTGATSGIGLALAEMLVRRGAVVVGMARSADRLESLEAAAGGGPGKFYAVPADVTDPGAANSAVDQTVSRFGRIDVLVCNAGVYVRVPVRQSTLQDYERAMAVNFYGGVRLILRTLPFMLKRRKGSIVAITSMDGKKGLPPDAPYVASKFAMTGFMDVLRQELHGTGVTATTVLPGRVDTPMIDWLTVPKVSAKVSAVRVARAVLRGIRRQSAEVFVPYPGLKLLAAANTVSASLGDWLVRMFGLEGEEKKPL